MDDSTPEGPARATDRTGGGTIHATLAPLLVEPFSTMDDVVDRLIVLERTLFARRDRRAIFVTAYVNTSRDLRRRIGEGVDYQWNRFVR
jgi:hypothetical protein